MVDEKNYLINLLKESGIKTAVYTSYKRLNTANELQLAAVIPAPEDIVRSSSKTKYTDQEGRRQTRYKLWDRLSRFTVIIAGSTDEKVEEIFVNFLLQLKKGIAVDQNWEGIDLSDVEWFGEGDCILKSKMTVRFQVAFAGGVYKDSDIKTLTLGEVTDDRQEDMS